MSIVAQLSDIIKEGACIVGVGNRLRRDDMVGPYIIDGLMECTKECTFQDNIYLVNAEDVLESFVFVIAEKDFDNIVVIDAVKSGGEPGSVIFGEVEDYEGMLSACSTHRLSLKLAARIWRDCGKKPYLLGIEAADIEFGTGMTPEVKKSADMIRDMLVSIVDSTRKEYAYEQ